jgi:hypothetical protein
LVDVVAESIRDVLAESAAVIARVTAQIGVAPQDDVNDDTAIALSIVDAWDRQLEHLMRESRLAENARDFREKWPALVRWRDRVLAHQKKAKPGDVAAAYESLALECELAGEYHLAAKAQQAAIDVIRSRGPKVVPIRAADEAVAQSA